MSDHEEILTKTLDKIEEEFKILTEKCVKGEITSTELFLVQIAMYNAMVVDQNTYILSLLKQIRDK